MRLGIAIATALLGSAAGAGIVLAGEPEKPAAPPAVAPARRPAEDMQPLVEARDVAIDVTAPDPEGGPEWAVRRFTTGKPEGVCAELGRIVDGQFGWIDGYGTFRAARAGHHEAPDQCVDPAWLRKIEVQPLPTTTVVYPQGGSPQPARGIYWGFAAAGVAAVEPDGAAAIPTTPHGLFLSVSTRQANPDQPGEAIRRDGSRRRYDFRPDLPTGHAKPVPGTTRVAIRAPDPAGGQPWAILVAGSSKGGLCFSQPGRLLGDRLGEIRAPLDTFSPLFDMLGCPDKRRAPTRAYPLRLTTGIWGASLDDDTQGRIERRTLTGRTIISGRVHPDVLTVTLKTPRDVRTLVPSELGRLILAAYDGTFPTGTVTATARMRDGRTVTRGVYVG
jgi:hypothetical protein